MLKQIVSLSSLLPLILCNISGNDGYDNLHQAIYNKRKGEVIRSLNNARGTPSFMKLLESKIVNDYTPLISAILNGNIDIAKILVKEGANLNAKDKFMETPLHHVINCQDRNRGVMVLVRMMLLKGANIDAVDHSNTTPLIKACKEGKEHIAMEFLKKRANVHCEDNSSCTALHYAAENGLESLVDALVQKKAELQKWGWKETPQQCALRNGNKDVAFILGVLASKGADVEVKNEEEDTALIITVKNGMENCANALLTMGADPNGKGKESCTPMHWAVLAGRGPSWLDFLLRHGCDPNVKNIIGKSPLDFAIANIVERKYSRIGSSWRLKKSLAFTLIEAGVNVPADDMEYLMNYLLYGHPDNDLPFDDFIMTLSTSHSNPATVGTFVYNLKIERLVEHYEEVNNFTLYRLLKLWFLKRGMKYVSELETLTFVIYDELILEMAKNTYMEKLPLELVFDTLNYGGGYYKWKLERLAWNVALASRYLNYGCYCCKREETALAKQLLKNFIFIKQGKNL